MKFLYKILIGWWWPRQPAVIHVVEEEPEQPAAQDECAEEAVGYEDDRFTMDQKARRVAKDFALLPYGQSAIDRLPATGFKVLVQKYFNLLKEQQDYDYGTELIEKAYEKAEDVVEGVPIPKTAWRLDDMKLVGNLINVEAPICLAGPDNSTFPDFLIKMYQEVMEMPEGRFVKRKHKAAEKLAEELGREMKDVPKCRPYVRYINPRIVGPQKAPWQTKLPKKSTSTRS